MRIGGFIKQSLVDWDGRLCAVIFTRSCNLRCFYCHNPTLVLPNLFHEENDIDAGDILEYLSRRASFLDGVVITGGEPTVQSDIAEFIAKIKSMDYAVKLDTNGSNPDILRSLTRDSLLDFVAMDIKHELDFAKYSSISKGISRACFEKILESVAILEQKNIPFVFRTTVVPGIHSKESIERLKRRFPGILLQSYRSEFETLKDAVHALHQMKSQSI